MVTYMRNARLSRLRNAMDHCRKATRCFREKREDNIRQYVGTNYSDNGSDKEVPVPLLALYVNILSRIIFAKSPKVLVSTPVPSLQPAAYDLQLAINATIKRIRFEQTMRLATLDAIFMQSVVKIAMYESGSANLYGANYQGYHPFAEVVDLDDFSCDITAKRWDKMAHIEDRYRVPYDAVMESDMFDRAAKESLSPTSRKVTDEYGDHLVETIGAGDYSEPDEYRDHVELWDVYLPDEQIIVTLPAEGTGPCLREQEWSGPQMGPYHRLGFIDVPNNVLKMGPVAMLRNLHDLANQMYRKLQNQAVNQKTILGVMAEAAEDAETVKSAGDGSIVNLMHPDKIRELSFRGIEQLGLLFFKDVMSTFSYFGGNMDSWGGLGAQADTARQEELISGNASQQVQDMQAIAATFMKECCEAIGHLLWHDPLIELPMSRPLPGFADISMPITWTPEHRIGEFFNYNIEIAPYSMREKTPLQQLNSIMTFIREVVPTMMPFMQAEQATVNFEGLARAYALYTDMPELEQIITFSGPPRANRPAAVGEPLAKPAHTTRTYERINKPGLTKPGQDQVMQQLLAGSSLQDGQRMALNRGVG